MNDRSRERIADRQTTQICECPCCGADVPKYPQYSPWCDSCDWNLQPSPAASSTQFPDSLLANLGQRSDEHLFQRVVSAETLSARLTSTQFLALFLSTIIYVLNFAVLFGAWNLLQTGQFLPMLIGGMLAGGVIWMLWPRFGAMPPGEVLTQADDFPAINSIVEQVAGALGVKTPHILLTEQFTATFGRVGFGRKPVLCLGHPFLSILSDDEIISLLAHELSHSRDGAITRSIFVRVALTNVVRWKQLLSPLRFRRIRNNFLRLATAPIWMTLTLLVMPFQLLDSMLTWCCFRDSKLAEYVADAKSMPVAGNFHAVSLLKKSYYRHLEALRIAYDSAPIHLKYARLKQQLAAIPTRELERIWRIALRQPARLESTHPSLPRRIAFLSKYRPMAANISISNQSFRAMEAELAAWPRVIRTREEEFLNELDRATGTVSDHPVAVPTD